jgi:SAM-dependent methyltransferase
VADDDYRSRSHATWEAMAPGWERERAELWEVSHVVGEWMVEKLAPEPGQTLLELAAGPGDTGFLAAPLLGENGRLISTDFSPSMVEVARRRGAELGLANVDYRVLDAEQMELESDSVDGVICRWGYMLMADPQAAFRETRRVLRPGGRLVLSVWGAPERNPWALPGRILVERGLMPPPDPATPGLFNMADPRRITQLATTAGFAEPEIEEQEVIWAFDDFDGYWRFITDLAGALSMILTQLPEEEREDVRHEVEQGVAPYHSDGGLVFRGLCLNAAAS